MFFSLLLMIEPSLKSQLCVLIAISILKLENLFIKTIADKTFQYCVYNNC